MTLIERIDSERRALSRMRRGAVVAGCIAAALLVVAAAVALLGSGRWLWLPASLPLVLWSVVIPSSAAVALFAFAHDRRPGGTLRMAELIERERGLRAGSVRSAVEVAGSGPLGGASADRMLRDIGAGAAAPRASQSGRSRSFVAIGALAVAAVGLTGARSAAPDGWRAVAHPVRAWRGTLLGAPYFISPPNAVVRGERVRLRISAPGRAIMIVSQRATGAPWRRDTVRVQQGIAIVDAGPVTADLSVAATDGRATTDTLHVRMVEQPFLGDVTVRAIYPAYLGRAAETLPAGAPLVIPRGTLLDVSGRASTALASVALVQGRQRAPMQPAGHAFSGRVQLAEGGEWIWDARGIAAAAIDVPPPLRVSIIPDSAPVIALLAPAADSLVGADGRVRMTADAADDHGLSLAAITITRGAAGARVPAGEPLAIPVAGQFARGSVELDLGALRLQPGDEIHIRAIAVDASPWRQRSESREITLRMPELAEQRSLARAAADSAVAGASAAARAQRELERRTTDAARAKSRRSTPPGEQASAGAGDKKSGALPFEAAEKARAVARDQRALGERVTALREQAKALERQLRQAGAMDSALAARLQDAQRMLRDALTPQMAASLQRLEQATQQLDDAQARDAMRNLAAEQKQLREQLERSAEMLKRAALEGALQTLRDDAREIAAKQGAVADSMKKSAVPPEVAQRLADRSRDLARDVNTLQDRLERERAESGARRTEKAAEHAAQSAKSMQRAAKPSGAKPGEQAAQSGSAESAPSQPEAAEEASREMEKAADALAEARQAQVDEWKQELTAELDRSIQEMLQLAREEEQLAARAQSGDSPPDLRSEQSALQQGAGKSGERLAGAGKKSSLLSAGAQRAVAEAQRKVEAATGRATNSRDGAETAGAMRDASSALNRAAAALVRDRERVNRASSASGFAEMMEQMRQLAQQQGALNAQAAGLAAGQPGSAGQAATAGQLARGQRGVAQALGELGDADGSGTADELAREAQQIAQALERSALDPQVLQRQQRLYRRLLDAGRSLEQDERDDQGKREARAGSDAERLEPPGTASGKPGERFTPPAWNELRGLSAEERRLVIEYFRRLNVAP